MNPFEPPLPVRLMLVSAWATLVGLVAGSAITLACIDPDSVAHWRAALRACPEEGREM